MKRFIVGMVIALVFATSGVAGAEQTFELGTYTLAKQRFLLALVDASDGITPETGEADGQPLICRGSSCANTTNTLNHIQNGAYFINLTQAELSTEGHFIILYVSANTAQFWGGGNVQPKNAWATDLAGLKGMILTLQKDVDWIVWKLEKEEKRALNLREITQ